MHNTHFQQYLTRLHELGEFGIAMDEAKAFLDVYAAKKGTNDVLSEWANDLTHLQSRWSSLEKEAQKGVLDRRDFTRERNEISHTLLTWLEELKKAPLTHIPYADFGQGLSADLREKIFGKAEEEEAPPQYLEPSRPPNRRWVAWLLGVLVLPLGYMGYRYFVDDTDGSCILHTYYNTILYSAPDFGSTQILAFGENKKVKPLGLKIVKNDYATYTFFKVKEKNVEGWIYYEGLEKTPECFKVIEEYKKKEAERVVLPKPKDDIPKVVATPTTKPIVKPSPPKINNKPPKTTENKPHKAVESPQQPNIEESGCYLTAGMLTTLFSEATMFSEQIGELRQGKRYKILDKEIYDHHGLSKTTFFKVNDGSGNIGWVMQRSDLKVPANCR